MKLCRGCDTTKDEEEFSINSSKSDGRHPRCRACVSKYHRARYESGAIDKKALRNRARKQRVLLRSIVQQHLIDHPCEDCGEDDLVVLEFDHVRGQKRDEVTRLVRLGVGEETLRAEIAKCEVRCANCHRRVTAKRRKRST